MAMAMDAASVTTTGETLMRILETPTRPIRMPRANPRERMLRARDSGMPWAMRWRGSQFQIYGWDLRIHIEHPEQYFRQYIAVKVSGQNRIFVNSFCDETPPSDWHDKLYVVTDGATCFWQALYDPATKLFSNLRIDARA
jgi:hypothetical protein